MRKTTLVAACILLVACLGPGRLVAENNPLQAVYTEWFPYTYSEAGKPAGFEIEIVRAVFKRLGYDVEFTSYPWKRCLSYLENGRADILVSMLKTREREVFAFYPDTYLSLSRTSLFSKAKDSLEYNGDFERLRGVTIGVISGFSYGRAFEQAKFLLKDDSTEVRVLIEKLLSGRIDLGAENEIVTLAVAKRLGVADKIRFLSPPLHEEKLYVGFSRTKALEELGSRFSDELKAFKASPEYQDILSKYAVEELNH